MTNEKQVRKMVMASLPKFKFYAGCSFLFALVIHMLALIPPLIMRNVIDVHIPNAELAQTVWLIIVFISIPIATTALFTYYNYIVIVSGRNAGHQLIIRAFKNILHQPLTYFDQNNSAEIAAYCKSEAMNYAVFWLMTIPRLIASILVGLTVFGLIIFTNVWVGLVLLLYLPLSILPSKKFAQLIAVEVKKVIDNNAKTNHLMATTFKGIKFIKAMTLEQRQLSKINELNQSTIKVWSKAAAIENLNGSWVNNFVDNLLTGIIFTITAVFVINQTETIGTLVLLLGFLPLFFTAVKSIANANFDFAQQTAQFDKFFAILTMNTEQDGQKNKKAFTFNREIRFNKVNFSYNDDTPVVLKELSLTIPKGKWVGIVGPSGSGKSTILDLLSGFYDRYDGEICVDEVELKSIDVASLRQNITKVSQDLFLLPGTLRENLLAVNEQATDEQLMTVLHDVGLADFVAGLPAGLDTDIGEDGTLISGGQKQRICLAIGLLRRSQILLLDEITSALDEQAEILIRENILKLMTKHDITVVAISHKMAFLTHADEIIRLDEDVN